ncbi:MAG TPA: DNA polymerase III subunit gamma/tau [Stellaceae bacterium]|nr:DNA polymerase III subunit gamma/tau [Stellaceae bacterium]
MSEPGGAYRVLARKYRPSTFAELIGQEAMVKTLTNAIATGRIAHAFILTGVRGVGKTTTARIIARALNCIGPDGKGGPTASPCGVCEPCKAIADDRFVDVMEMDAASRTGVDEIRELTDGVRYKPVAARFKIYIIDEVHMLSKAAFNALLKTLEEPPPDVKFIFATTEIHKVPVTVLSRCQRFSLRRVPQDMLAAHYAAISEKESIKAEPQGIALIARAADGSVRDGLSILDQAMALGGEAITEAAVRDMLGIADRGLVFDLLEAALKGDAGAALAQMKSLYEGGADPIIVLQDLLELAHFLTRLKLAPNAGEGDPAVEGDRARGLPLAQKLGIPALTRAWQLLLKGLEEAQAAPSPLQAAEMVLVRLAYVADLPSPAEIIRAMDGAPAASAVASSSSPRVSASPAPVGNGGGGGSTVGSLAMREAPSPAAAPTVPQPTSFLQVVELFEKNQEALVRAQLYAHAHLVSFEMGRIGLRLDEGAPRDLTNKLATLLSQWTGQRWLVSISSEEGEPTLKEQVEARAQTMKSEAASDPLVRAVLDAFPGARIESVRETVAPPAEPMPDADELPDEEDVL